MYRHNSFLFIHKRNQIVSACFRHPLEVSSIFPRKSLAPRHGDFPDGSARLEGLRHEGRHEGVPSSNVNGERGFGLVTLELDGCSDPEPLRLLPRDNVRSLNNLIISRRSKEQGCRSTWTWIPLPSGALKNADSL